MVVCTKKLLVFKRSTSFDGFLQNAILFAKNMVKTLKHGNLHKKLLVLKRSTSFDGFSQNAILFATFCQKFGQNPKTW